MYKLGGRLPTISNYMFHECSRLFYEFASNYSKVQGVRKSIPNHDMLLSAILTKAGYQGYYDMPIIQSRKIRDNIYYIIKECLG